MKKYFIKMLMLLSLILLVLSSITVSADTTVSGTFQNPLTLLDHQDPGITNFNGNYYYAHSEFTTNTLRIYSSSSLTGIFKAGTETIIKPPAGYYSVQAPNIQAFNNKLYVYVGFRRIGTDECTRKTYVYESNTSNIADGFTLKGDIGIGYSFDVDVFQRPLDSTYWVVYNGSNSSACGGYQDIKIRKMTNPYTLSADAPVSIVTTTNAWESTNLESAVIVERNGKIVLFYSANHWDQDGYAVGYVSFTGTNLDRLDNSAKWAKYASPILASGNGVTGPGAMSVVKTPDGTEYWGMFGAHPYSGTNMRDVRIQKINWNVDGTPYFSTLTATGASVNVPSGESPYTITTAVQNGGLETGDYNYWRGFGFITGGVVANNAYTGTYAVKLIGGSTVTESSGALQENQVQTDIKGLEPNTTYQVTAWSKRSSTSEQANISVILSGGSNISSPINTADYAMNILTFTTGSVNDMARIKIIKTAGSGSVYIDDVKIAKAKQLYRIVNKNSGKVISVDGTSTADGANVWQWSDLSHGDQQWSLEPTDSGYYKIRAIHSGKLMEVVGGSTTAGANVQQFTDNGTLGQQWKPISTGDGYYKLQNRSSGLLLDVGAASTADGGNIQQWTDNGCACQRWVLEPLGNVKLINENSSKVLDVGGASTVNGGNIQQWNDNGCFCQSWSFVSLANGYFKVVNQNSGKVIDIVNTISSNGQNIQQYDYLANAGQKWRLVINNNGNFQLRPALDANRTMEVINGSLLDGANVQLWDANGTSGQYWKVTPSGK